VAKTTFLFYSQVIDITAVKKGSLIDQLTYRTHSRSILTIVFVVASVALAGLPPN
jgi:hypothetical protein